MRDAAAHAGSSVSGVHRVARLEPVAVHRGQPVAMLGLKVDFLTNGCRYDVRKRTGLVPAEAAAGEKAMAVESHAGSLDR